MTDRTSPEHDSDYDGVWKEALREDLRVFLTVYFLNIASRIDWSVPLEWLDKELSQILGDAGVRNKHVDLLVRARLLDGETCCFLLHLEVQTSYEPDFPERMAQYNAGVFWIFRERVVSLVILADLRRNWCPDQAVYEFAGFENRLTWPVCKLIERVESDWVDDFSLPVQVARAQIAALRTAGDAEGRFEAKWQFVRNLYTMGYTADELRKLFRLIDWMMHLRPDLEHKFETRLHAYEEEIRMPYVTSIERNAEARGEARGRLSMAIEFLENRFGGLPESVSHRLLDLSDSDRDDFLATFVSNGFGDLDALTDWVSRRVS